ncbi:MAG: ArnT family glycosyltransferase [Sedimentisphaerales bacterium]
MSKAARKTRRSKRHIKPPPVVPPAEKQRKKNLVVFIIIALLAAIPFSMGKYFEFNSPGPFDSGAYVYSAAHILDGAEIGVEEKPSAQLGTLLVNILGVWLFGFNEIGPKLIQMFMQAAALLLMFIAMRKLFGTLAAAVGVIVASVYLSAPLIAKFGNVKEQYMIVCMIIGISCFVLHQLEGRWWHAVLAGAFLSWAPLFKPTGTSAIGAIGFFVILQPILKNRAWRQTGLDILLLFAGAVAAIAPLYVWIIAWDVQFALPYSFVWQTLAKFLPSSTDAQQAKAATDYVSASRKLVPFSQQWPVVLRFYRLLILPIALAAAAIIVRILRMIRASPSTKKTKLNTYDRFVLLLAVWWVLDTAFVWISPRSYEQYYLPLTASAAMLSGYVVAIYYDKLKVDAFKTKWIITGLAGLLLMIIMSWHIFFGIGKSPYSGITYGTKTKGYLQKFREISQKPEYPWEAVGEYIRANSQPSDKIYVWGWYPGIYVKAQRFSSASKAFSMPRPTPPVLAELVSRLLTEFRQEMPKFIVDSRKRHIPTERPAYELWPIVPQGFIGVKKAQFLPPDKNTIEAFDKAWSNMLRERFDEDEALRYEALRPFRDFVMENYKIVRMFGPHVLFELKNSTVNKEQQ